MMKDKLWAMFSSRIGFLVTLSAAMVVMRILSFEWHYFVPACIPNHEFSQGLGYLATNAHSLRLTGELAYWNPISDMGNAYYYQSFFSPLAPTPTHLVFLLWSLLIRGLAVFGLAIPEYYQYLILNCIILPFLTNLAFSAFLHFLFRTKTAIAVVLIAYTLSGIGLWNGAWFYFQEPATLFFLLAALFGWLARPTPFRLLVVGFALLIQFTALNYWTVYNIFFYLTLLISYAIIYPHHVRRAIRRTLVLLRRYPAHSSLLLGGAFLVVATWTVLFGSILQEQAGKVQRTSTGSDTYTMSDAQSRVAELRRSTIELFSPSVVRSLHHYPYINEMHCCRYLGCALLPLLMCFAILRWNRRDRWLVLSAGFILAICMACPLFLWLWQVIPMMDRNQHLFYFYSHYWQLMVVLVAGASLDRLVVGSLVGNWRQRGLVLLGGLSGYCFLVIGTTNRWSHLYPTHDPGLEGLLRASLVTLLASLLLFQYHRVAGIRSRLLICFLLPFLLLVDLSLYFAETSKFDRAMTVGHLGNPYSLPSTVRRAVRYPLPSPGGQDHRSYHASLWQAMPIQTWTWPNNRYLVQSDIYEMAREFPELTNEIRNSSPDPLPCYFRTGDQTRTVQILEFYPGAVQLDDPAAIEAHLEESTLLPAGQRLLAVAQPCDPPGVRPLTQFWLPAAIEDKSWSYNSLSYQVDLALPGWLLFRQPHDPLWTCTINGIEQPIVRANRAFMAVQIPAGKHAICFDYRPVARWLFPRACLLLEGYLLVLTGYLVVLFRRSCGNS